MSRLAIAALVLCTGCLHGRSLFRSAAAVRAEAAADSLYRGAVAQLVATDKPGSRDSAMTLLEAYLKTRQTKHRAEAAAFLALARDAAQLARVQEALQQERAVTKAVTTDRARVDSQTKGRDEDAVKEIARLRDELARAREELERIKKRLAAPPPKP